MGTTDRDNNEMLENYLKQEETIQIILQTAEEGFHYEPNNPDESVIDWLTNFMKKTQVKLQEFEELKG